MFNYSERSQVKRGAWSTNCDNQNWKLLSIKLGPLTLVCCQVIRPAQPRTQISLTGNWKLELGPDLNDAVLRLGGEVMYLVILFVIFVLCFCLSILTVKFCFWISHSWHLIEVIWFGMMLFNQIFCSLPGASIRPPNGQPTISYGGASSRQTISFPALIHYLSACWWQAGGVISPPARPPTSFPQSPQPRSSGVHFLLTLVRRLINNPHPWARIINVKVYFGLSRALSMMFKC